MYPGARLYEPSTKSHSALLANGLLKTLSAHWIGIHDRFEEGSWVYLSSSASIPYTNWNSDEPNNHGGDEDCVVLGESHDGWHAWNCDWGAHFICEKK